MNKKQIKLIIDIIEEYKNILYNEYSDVLDTEEESILKILKEQLILSSVSHQRELLTEYEKFASGENYINSKPLIDKQIKEFIEVNCG